MKIWTLFSTPASGFGKHLSSQNGFKWVANCLTGKGNGEYDDGAKDDDDDDNDDAGDSDGDDGNDDDIDNHDDDDNDDHDDHDDNDDYDVFLGCQ